MQNCGQLEITKYFTGIICFDIGRGGKLCMQIRGGRAGAGDAMRIHAN